MMHRFVFCAGILSCLALVLPTAMPASARGGRSLVFASEQNEEPAAGANDTAGEIEDDLLADLASGITGETELDHTPGLIISGNVEELIASMSSDEIAEYAQMIESILRNPDFQSLLQYEEVRDLAVTLFGNALNFAVEDPGTTQKILETLGLNRGAILLLYEVLGTMEENKKTTDAIQAFLDTKEGQMLTQALLDNLSKEQLDQMLVDLNKALTNGSLAR